MRGSCRAQFRRRKHLPRALASEYDIQGLRYRLLLGMQVSLDTSGATPDSELGPLNGSESQALQVLALALLPHCSGVCLHERG